MRFLDNKHTTLEKNVCVWLAAAVRPTAYCYHSHYDSCVMVLAGPIVVEVVKVEAYIYIRVLD